MTLLDRHILQRFLANFVLLFGLLFVFAATIDIVLALDEFLEVARDAADEASALMRALIFIKLIVDFQGPRVFQFYAYLHGLTAVGAAGFTLAQMHRARELVAMLAAGIPMHRIAMPFIFGVFLLSIVQLINQELLLPRVAPMLLRGHGEIGMTQVRAFPIELTQDGDERLFQSPAFIPEEWALVRPTIIERDERGRTIRRISAERAVWQEPDPATGQPGGWRLEGGEVVSLEALRTGDPAGGVRRELIDFEPSDLSPRVLTVRRYRQFAGLLSLRQIGEVLNTPGAAEQQGVLSSLIRHRYGRFATVLLNILVMWLTLPTFLLREPGSLLRSSVMCAAIAIPTLLGAAVFMTVDLPGIAPAVGVFLPVVILLFIVPAQWTVVRT